LEGGLLHLSRFFITMRVEFIVPGVTPDPEHPLSRIFFMSVASDLSGLSKVMSKEFSVSDIRHELLDDPGFKSTSVADELHLSSSTSLSIWNVEDVG
jgi:hypothetical protein